MDNLFRVEKGIFAPRVEVVLKTPLVDSTNRKEVYCYLKWKVGLGRWRVGVRE